MRPLHHPIPCPSSYKWRMRSMICLGVWWSGRPDIEFSPTMQGGLGTLGCWCAIWQERPGRPRTVYHKPHPGAVPLCPRLITVSATPYRVSRKFTIFTRPTSGARVGAIFRTSGPASTAFGRVNVIRGQSWFDRCAFTRNSKVEIDQVMMFQCTTSLSTMNVRASLLLVVHHWVGEPFPSGGESRVLRAPTDWRRGEQLRNMRSLDSIDVTVSSPHSNDTNPSSLTLRIVLALSLWIFPNPRRWCAHAALAVPKNKNKRGRARAEAWCDALLRSGFIWIPTRREEGCGSKRRVSGRNAGARRFVRWQTAPKTGYRMKKRALKRDWERKRGCGGRREVENEGKLALFVVVKYKM